MTQASDPTTTADEVPVDTGSTARLDPVASEPPQISAVDDTAEDPGTKRSFKERFAGFRDAARARAFKIAGTLRTPKGRWAIGAVGIVVIAAILGTTLLAYYKAQKPGKETKVAKTASASVTKVDNKAKAKPSPNPDGVPLIPGGVKNWTDVQAKATPAVWLALRDKHGITQDDVRKWAAEEQLMKRNFKTNLAAGTPINNTGRKGSGYFSVNGYRIKPGDTLCLKTDKGVIVIKCSCGNVISIEVIKQFAVVPQAPSVPIVNVKAPRNSSPLTTPHHPDNPYTQPPSDHKSGSTPGYTPGNAEDTEDHRGTGEGTTGEGGTGTSPGASTPGGSSSDDCGNTEVTPPPSSDPPAPPPPNNNSGGTIPQPD